MRKLLVVALLCGHAIALYYYLSPIRALDGLRSAIERGDAAELEERVDFPSVRESLKAEIAEHILADVAPEMSDNPFGVLAMGLASKMIDAFLEAAVTPSGLARMARGDSRPVSPDEREPRERRPRGPEELFRDARIDRETSSRFSAWVPADDGDEIRFVFRRSGLSWRLSAIELPAAQGRAQEAGGQDRPSDRLPPPGSRPGRVE